MFYRASVMARTNSLIKRALRKAKKLLGGRPETTNADLVRKYAPGRSFADIGALWGVDGLNSFIAEESGARRVIAVDIYPASPKFLEQKRLRRSKVEFVQGDIHLSSTAEAVGKQDVVLCSGVLYHTPDPVHLLTRLHAVCGDILILNTASIPELPGIRNAAVFYPFLDAGQRGIWNLHAGSQKAITGEYEPEEGYANWFWGMTPSSIESMLKCVGFEIEERFVTPFKCIFVCRATDSKFKAASGEWNVPKQPNPPQSKK